MRATVDAGTRFVESQHSFVQLAEVMQCRLCERKFDHTYEMAKHVFTCTGGVPRPQPVQPAPASQTRRSVLSDGDVAIIDSCAMQHFNAVGGTPVTRHLQPGAVRRAAWLQLAAHLQQQPAAVRKRLRLVVLNSVDPGERRTMVTAGLIADWCERRYSGSHWQAVLRDSGRSSSAAAARLGVQSEFPSAVIRYLCRVVLYTQYFEQRAIVTQRPKL
jgi:hypothetical protein